MTFPLLVALLLFIWALLHALYLERLRSVFVEAVHRSSDQVRMAGMEGRPQVSVVVPVRNEEMRIAPLLQDLHAQEMDRERYEVIVVDDGSTDATSTIAKGMADRWRGLHIITLHGDEGKKAALVRGCRAAKGLFVLASDGDVRHGPRHLPRVSARMASGGIDLLLMPVWTVADRGWCQLAQQLEQAALLGAAMGSALIGRPILANGANLAFRRDLLLDRRRDPLGTNWASGDDMFMLAAVSARDGAIEADPHPDALVRTQAVSGWRAYFDQRLRWAGKMRAVSIPRTRRVGIATMLLPWSLAVASFWFGLHITTGQALMRTWSLTILAWGLWCVPIIALVNAVHGAYDQRTRSLATLTALCQFTILAPIIAVLAIFVRPLWKGRRI
ncbi:MAG: glycosyltransferase [Flavobacteriales bacterium]|nr:glycosyltransferase [Flavobacteriales bacterium]